MSLRYDYIMNQVEKACQLIAALMTTKKITQKEEAEINQTLSELTGLGLDIFSDDKNASALPVLLSMMSDDNTKAVVAKLLELKNSSLYGDTVTRLRAELSINKLHPEVKKLFS